MNSVVWEEAFHVQSWRWAGHLSGSAQAVLRGDLVVDLNRNSPPFWKWDGFSQQLVLSTRHLRETTISHFVSAMKGRAVKVLRVYPSSALHFVRLAANTGLELPLTSVITGSEPLYDWQRAAIEDFFCCKVFDFYGMAERVAFAAQCEFGSYHLNPYYSWVEILDGLGRATDDFGDIVGTTFHNAAMPLIRYRLTDRARWHPGSCQCGRSYPRIELSSGKVEDQIFDTEGLPISASIITFPFKDLRGVRRAQVAQIDRAQWEIRLVPDADFTGDVSDRLIDRMRQFVSPNLVIRVRVVPDIPLLPSGKFKWVSQEWRRT